MSLSVLSSLQGPNEKKTLTKKKKEEETENGSLQKTIHKFIFKRNKSMPRIKFFVSYITYLKQPHQPRIQHCCYLALNLQIDRFKLDVYKIIILSTAYRHNN